MKREPSMASTAQMSCLGSVARPTWAWGHRASCLVLRNDDRQARRLSAAQARRGTSPSGWRTRCLCSEFPRTRALLITDHRLLGSNPHGRGCGVGRSLGIGLGLGVGVGRGVGVGVAVAVGVAVGLGVGVTSEKTGPTTSTVTGEPVLKKPMVAF